jgi:hypothetical protein
MRWLLGSLIDAIDRLTAEIRRQSQWLRQPSVRVRLTRQESTMLVYSVSAAAPIDNDVVERRLTVDVVGSEPTTITFPGDATDLGEIKVEQGATVTLSLVDVDDAGNPSTPAVAGPFEAVDTIAPAKPGEFGVTLVREE